MQRVLVLGGSGFVGRATCRRLAERWPGLRIVVPTRRLAHAGALRVLPGIELDQADVHDPTALDRLLAGADAVVNLIAILHGGAAEFERAHVALPRQLASGCARAGVGRLVHVSALGVGPNAPSLYLRSKTAGEEVLRGGNTPFVLLRPSVIFGAEDRFINLFAELQAFAPLLPLAGAAARFQPVWVEDVAEAIVRALAAAASGFPPIVECAGPQVYTLSELARLAGRWSGSARPQLALPDALARLQAAVMERLPGPTLMSRDNLDSMRVPNVAGGSLPGLRAIGITPSAIEQVMPALLAGRSAPSLLDRWRARR